MNPINRLKPRTPARVIVVEPCLLRAIDEPEYPLRHAETGERVTLKAEEADNVVGAGRGLYLDIADDRTKGKLTATKEQIEQIDFRAKQWREAQQRRERAAAEPSQTSALPADFNAAVAQAVAAELTRRGIKG